MTNITSKSSRARSAMILLAASTLLTCSDVTSTPDSVEHFTVTYSRVEALDGSGEWREVPLADLESDPLPYATRSKVTVEISAFPPTGDFDGYVQVYVVPGTVLSVTSESSDVTRTGIRVVSGETARAEVEIEGSFGPTRILVEDAGHLPVPPEVAACDDGVDNDNDGVADYPFDPGCILRNDGSEEPGTHAVGVSDTIAFQNPRLNDVQGCDVTPDLERQSVTVDRGHMYVTAVTANGFYVSDRSALLGGCDPASGCCNGGRFAHMYAYNFNTPWGIRVCDRLASVGGIVGDFFGFTELNFPSWERYDIDEDPSNGMTLMRENMREITDPDEGYRLCPLEDVDFELTAEMIPDRRLMETFESALVHATNVTLPTEWINCDYNDNGNVAYSARWDELTLASEVRLPDELFSVYCTMRTVDGRTYCSEVQCNDTCVERNCAELTTYRQHGQYPVLIDGVPILVVTSSNVPEFNPREQALNGEVNIARIGGMLKEFAPLDTPWIIEPRCPDDIWVEGYERYPDIPVYQRCVPSEQTGDLEDPY